MFDGTVARKGRLEFLNLLLPDIDYDERHDFSSAWMN